MTLRAGHTVRALPLCALTLALVAAALGSWGCGDGSGQGSRTVIQNKGSDTLVNVAQVWAEEYRKVAPDVQVEVSGGGSGVGIAALIKGTVDMANASRNIKPGEAEQAEANTGRTPMDFVVGYDALAVFVHRNNPLDEISFEQLSAMYREDGPVLRWSDMGVTIPGARDNRIVLVSRQSSSGTYEFFRQHALENKDFRLGSRDLNGSKEVVELIGATPTAIGYSGMGYATPAVKMLRVAPRPGAPAVPPSIESVHAGTYPLARSLHVYTLGEPPPHVRRYLDWILSAAGQRVVEESGYVPVATDGRKPS